MSNWCLTFFQTSAHTFQSLAHFAFLWVLYVGWDPGLSLFLFMCLSSCPTLLSKVITFLSGKLCFWTSVLLIHLFNCLGYCGFTESFEMRKAVLSNAVLQGCFGLRQYKTPESPHGFRDHFVSFWKKKKAGEDLRKVMPCLCAKLRVVDHCSRGLFIVGLKLPAIANL